VPGTVIRITKDENVRNEKVRVGTRLVQQLSTTFYPHPQIIFDELVSNAHDALASTVRIFLEKDSIIIDDNGEGMTPDGLVHFFYISHTKKNEERVRSFKDVKRIIIGKFGIGKLSIYQICRKFEISTWRDGIESSATFDFDKFETEEFIENFDLEVKSMQTKKLGSGTRIVLLELKTEVTGRLTAKILAKRLSKTMPLDENFKVIVRDEKSPPITLTKEDIVGKKIKAEYSIEEPSVDGIGRVHGTVMFFKKEDQNNQGVFIRVLGRIVNFDNPKGIINLNNISHPRMFANKIRVDVNADGLDGALLTNRAGFIESDSSYQYFVEWLEKKINSFGELEYKKWQALKADIEKLEIPNAVSEAFDNSASEIPEFGDDKTTIKRLMAQQPLSKREKPTSTQSKLATLKSLIKKKKMKIEMRDLGIDEREAFFDKENGILIVNSTNPSYVFASAHAKLPGIAYHVFKAAMITIALENSDTLEEFEFLYNALSRNFDLLDAFDDALKRK